jgi:hypothetical protein
MFPTGEEWTGKFQEVALSEEETRPHGNVVPSKTVTKLVEGTKTLPITDDFNVNSRFNERGYVQDGSFVDEDGVIHDRLVKGTKTWRKSTRNLFSTQVVFLDANFVNTVNVSLTMLEFYVQYVSLKYF